MRRTTIYLISLLSIIAIPFISCNKDSSTKKGTIKNDVDSCLNNHQIETGFVTIPHDSCQDFNFGTRDLSPCAFKSIPYKTDTDLKFVDNLKNEIVFKLIAQKNNLYYRTFISKLNCNWDTAYHYTIEGKCQCLYFYMQTNSKEVDLWFDFTLSKEINVTINQIEFKENINISKYDVNNNQLNYTLICLYPEDPSVSENRSNLYPELYLNNIKFTDVFVSSENDLYYCYKYGLIGFRDNNQKMWVLNTK